MSEFHDNDPLLNLNGDPASPEDIQIMEGAAYAILETVPATLIHEYCVELPRDGLLMFRAEEVEVFEPDEDGQLKIVGTGEKALSIILAYHDMENVLASWTYDEESQREDIRVVEIDGPDFTMVFLQEAIESENFSEEEKRALAYFYKSTRDFKQPYLPEGKPVNMDDIDLVDQIHREVEQLTKSRSDYVVRAKEYAIPLDNNHAVSVINHEIKGDIIAFDDPSFAPKLLVVLENRETGIDHVFAREQSGDVREEGTDSSDFFPDESWDELEDEILKEMRDNMNFNRPGKAVVDQMTQSLLHAFLLEDLTSATE